MKTKRLFSFDLFFTEILQDEQGRFSSKRVVAFIGTFALLSAFIANTFIGLPVTEYIFQGLLALVLGALGITVGDAFAHRGRPVRSGVTYDEHYRSRFDEDDSPVDDPVL